MSLYYYQAKSLFQPSLPNLSCSPWKCLMTAPPILTLQKSLRWSMSWTGSDWRHWFYWWVLKVTLVASFSIFVPDLTPNL